VIFFVFQQIIMPDVARRQRHRHNSRGRSSDSGNHDRFQCLPDPRIVSDRFFLGLRVPPAVRPRELLL
jgi:hypothetical protein